jgi:hypothetical protein
VKKSLKVIKNFKASDPDDIYHDTGIVYYCECEQTNLKDLHRYTRAIFKLRPPPLAGPFLVCIEQNDLVLLPIDREVLKRAMGACEGDSRCPCPASRAYSVARDVLRLLGERDIPIFAEAMAA